MGAAVLTWLLVLIQDVTFKVAASDSVALSPALIFVGILGLITPFAVPLLWSWAALLGRPWTVVAGAFAAWVGFSLAIAPGVIVWPLASWVAAGITAAVALVWRLRLDGAILAVTIVLAPYFIWSFQEVSLDEQFDQVIEQYIEARKEMLEGTADPKQVEMTLESEKRQYREAADLTRKFLPAMMGMGIGGMAGIILAMAWVLAKTLGLDLGQRSWPPFGRWRLPFYMVWVLVVGLGLFITRQPHVATAGLNVALIVGTLMSVQGAAVQWEMTRGKMGLIVRILYLLVAGFIFLPLVVLGLADQWLDFRKLETSAVEDPPA